MKQHVDTFLYKRDEARVQRKKRQDFTQFIKKNVNEVVYSM